VAATSGTANCGGTVTITASDNGQTCPATITVTGTDNCGLTSTGIYTAYIITAPPTTSGCPTNTTIPCLIDLPAPATVTATDSCGRPLNLTYTQNPVNPVESCSQLITRTWSFTDCLGQSVSCTQVITQLNNVVPTANQGGIATCYTSLAAADAAALKATTSGTVGCGGSALTFTVSDNGQYCPAIITVTGADGCGNSVIVTYSATILTAKPTLVGVPAKRLSNA